MIANQVVGVTETSILTASTGVAIVSILFYNSDLSNRVVQCYAYPSGGSGGNNTTIFKVSIPSEDTFIWSSNEKLLLQSGAVVSAVCDVASQVTATINYLEV